MTNQMLIDRGQEKDELDPLTRQLVQERDRERLKKMTYYAFTNDCLRDYILRYFGEYGSNYCGNCQNCLTQFETADVTEAAREIIGCICSAGERYGAVVIADAVHGSNTAKIRQYSMDQNPHYGSLSSTPIYRIRQILNHLVLQGYLSVTNDGYSVIKAEQKGRDVLEGREEVQMKLAKKQEPAQTKAAEGKKSSGKRRAGATLTEAEETLFQKLRALRMEIAREEKIPPYIVFSDKSLISMTLLHPTTREEMLEISGVGEFKLEKYGERFLTCIRNHSGGGGSAEN